MIACGIVIALGQALTVLAGSSTGALGFSAVIAGSSTGTLGFSAVIQSAADQTTALVGAVQGLNLPAGNKTSLLAKLNAALQSIATGHTLTACNQLSAFINEVQAQAGKKIAAADAAALIAVASHIRATLGCP